MVVNRSCSSSGNDDGSAAAMAAVVLLTPTGFAGFILGNRVSVRVLLGSTANMFGSDLGS